MKEFIQVFTTVLLIIGAFVYVIFNGYPGEPYETIIGFIAFISGMIVTIKGIQECQH